MSIATSRAVEHGPVYGVRARKTETTFDEPTRASNRSIPAIATSRAEGNGEERKSADGQRGEAVARDAIAELPVVTYPQH
jgi:hypothetical protein